MIQEEYFATYRVCKKRFQLLTAMNDNYFEDHHSNDKEIFLLILFP